MKNNTLKNIIKKAAVFALLVVTLMCAVPSGQAHAANVCQEISGSSKGTVRFTVTTGSKRLFGNKIVLKASKGTMKYVSWFGNDKTSKMYDNFKVYYRKVGAASWKSKNLSGSKVTIKLDANSKYEFKVVPASIGSLQNSYRSLLKGALTGWASAATLKISKTKGVSFCK